MTRRTRHRVRQSLIGVVLVALGTKAGETLADRAWAMTVQQTQQQSETRRAIWFAHLNSEAAGCPAPTQKGE